MSDSLKEIMLRLKNGDVSAMNYLFDNYYEYLCKSIYSIVGDINAAEDIVQELFVNIWNKRETIEINTALKAYLRRSATNRAINHLRKKKYQFLEDTEAAEFEDDNYSKQLIMEADEMEVLIHQLIDQLPEKCRLVFSLSRFEDMTYKEIAERLGISVKTVENQMSKALKFLRNGLVQQLA